MNCPICGGETIRNGKEIYCPSCKIYVGQGLTTNSPAIAEPDSGEVFRQRARSSFRKLLLFSIVFLILASAGLAFFIYNYTSFGYREKVMSRYGFTQEAKDYLRSETKITVVNILETKPFGFNHSGKWSPHNNEVTLNSANDEVAIHEFAHAWWEVQRKDRNNVISLINDTIKLSKMEDPQFQQASLKAKKIVGEFCNCPDPDDQFFVRADDHHFFAYMADFTMAKYKTGSHQLPPFMWKYFEGLFTGEPQIAVCYESQSCFFPDNNGLSP
jgi:hypothetical protein